MGAGSEGTRHCSRWVIYSARLGDRTAHYTSWKQTSVLSAWLLVPYIYLGREELSLKSTMRYSLHSMDWPLDFGFANETSDIK